MRKNLLVGSFLTGTVLLTTFNGIAQQPDRFAYAITDIQPQAGANWSFLRKLNLQTGEYSQVLLSGNDASLIAYDATSKKQFTTPLNDAVYGTTVNAAFATGVAAMALDKKNNRLYYTPMFLDQLRYVDLKTMKVYFVTDHSFTGKAQKSPDQGNIVTRMVIASDGNGYALTNDSRQLIRFSLGKKMQVTDLGSVVDDQANTVVSIHSSCSSFGGDMVADDKGNLYVFSARNNIFKINTETKVATHLGVVSGLPNGFTINGAAIDDKNQIIVSSASAATSYFTVDPRSWSASPYTINGTVWQSSDLANGNLLVTTEKQTAQIVTEVVSAKSNVVADDRFTVFPNPVTAGKFSIQFNQVVPGNYTIRVTDVMGRQVIQQSASIASENQLYPVQLAASAGKGVYLVKVYDINNTAVFTTKVVVQ